ncbi:hypothetical protein RW115_08170 [Macrococcus capreoli]
MLKNILLLILMLTNGYFILSLTQNNTIQLLSIHIIVAGFAFIISILFLITRVPRLTQILSTVTMLITTYHIYLIVMIIYTYVYVK